MPSAFPLVSFVVPVFNRARNLPGCLDSLLAQTITDFEIIVSDNGSADDTPLVAQEYVRRDPRVRFIRHERNQGFSFNANHLLAAARGRYILCTGGNDRRPPDAVERSLRVLEGNPSVVLCYGRTIGADDEGEYEVSVDDLETRGLKPAKRFEKVVRNMSRGDIIYSLMRTDAVRGTRLYRNVYGHDHVIIAELSLQGEFARIPEPTLMRHEKRSLTKARRDVNRTLDIISPGIGRLHRRAPFFMFVWEHGLALWRGPLPWSQRILLTRRVFRLLRRRFGWGLREDVDRLLGRAAPPEPEPPVKEAAPRG